MRFGKKLGRFVGGVGKKLGRAYNQVRSFGKKAMKTADDLGVGDIVRDTGRELGATARATAAQQGVPVSQIESAVRSGQTAQGRRGMLRQGVQAGANRLTDRLRSMRQ